MGDFQAQYITETSGQVTLTSTGDKFLFASGAPIDVIRWGVLADALIDVGAGMTIKMDHRPTLGSDTSRTDGTPTTAENLVTTSDIAAGAGGYVELDDPFQVDPGEELVFQVTDAADTAGTGLIFIQYRIRPFIPGSGATAGTDANRVGNMTSL
jgi:hypothetical protein